MKKLITMIVCALLISVLTACTSQPHEESADHSREESANHTHEESASWTVDSTGHWKVCGGCDEKLQSGEHTLGDDLICTVCGAEVVDWEDSVSVYVYDEHENVIRIAEYDVDGKLISETVYEYTYDADGKMTAGKEYVDGQLRSEMEYAVIDGESLASKYTYYSEDGSKVINEFDSNGNLIRLIDYDAAGNVTMQIDSQYEKDGYGEWYEAASTELYANGTKIEAEYDEMGSTTSMINYDADGNVISVETWEYTYDENGFTATEKAYVDGVLATETLYKTIVEDDGTFCYPETVTTYHEDGSKTVCVYDENGELVSETTEN